MLMRVTKGSTIIYYLSGNFFAKEEVKKVLNAADGKLVREN